MILKDRGVPHTQALPRILKGSRLLKHLVIRGVRCVSSEKPKDIILPLGSLYIVPLRCKIDTNACLDVMTHPNARPLTFFCILDNVPSHASAQAKAWYEENMPLTRGNVIFQPPTSPDLNLLDMFFWSALKRQLARQYDTTAGGRILLCRDLQTAWAQLTAHVAMDKLLANWRRRLVLCVQQDGDVFEHLL